MKKKPTNTTINVRGTEITVIRRQDEDFISLTDMLKAKDGEFFISDWLRNRNTVEFLGIWETVHNPDFNSGEFAIIKSQAGLNSYKLSVKEWASSHLKEYIVKGFVMDDERLKNPGGWDYFDELLARIRDIRASEKRFYQKVRDLFALSSDYQTREKETSVFFAEVQNKLLYAATRQIAAEKHRRLVGVLDGRSKATGARRVRSRAAASNQLIVDRADPSQPNMALTTWSGSRLRRQDIIIAKNYLTEDEKRRRPVGVLDRRSRATGVRRVRSRAAAPNQVDKRAWLRGRQGDANLQKHLLVIHAHGHDFPNAGSLTVAPTHFHERLNATKRITNSLVLISIATDIAYHSPKAFPVCSAIISKLLSVLPTKAARVDAIQKIHAKLSQLPNTGHMEAWLQRISHSFVPNLAYKETLCRLVNGDSVALWNNDWITSATLKAAIDPAKIVNKAKLRSLKPIVRPKEIELFASERY